MDECAHAARLSRSGTAVAAVGLGLGLLTVGFAGRGYAAEAAAAASTSATATDSAENAAVVTYDQAFFAGFSAITAEDLLRRIPGIQDLLGGQGGGGPGFGGPSGGGGGHN